MACGRAWTDTVEGHAIDRGAQWLHASHANPLTEFAHQADIAVRPDDHQGAVLYEGGHPSPKALIDYKRAARALERRVWVGAMLGRRTLADVAGADWWTRTVATAMAELEMGAEASAVSLRDLLRTARGEDLAVAGGLGGLIRTFGKGVPVRLSHPVTAVDWSGPERITLSGPAGSIAARRLLVTVSTGVLQSGLIAFNPPLPPWKRRGIDGLPMGLLTKIVFILPRPIVGPAFRIDLGEVRSGHLHFVHFDPPRTVATVILGGPTARALTSASSAAVIGAGRRILSALVGHEAAATAVASVSDWDPDPFACGAYAVASPRVAGARRLYDRPIDRRLFFAGEASSTPQAGTVGGAVLAGRQAAKQINASLAERA